MGAKDSGISSWIGHASRYEGNGLGLSENFQCESRMQAKFKISEIFQEYAATEQGFFGLQFYLFNTNCSRIFLKIKRLTVFVLGNSKNNY